MLSLKRKRLGNALAWALKSQDGTFTSFLADKFLKTYVETGELLCIDLLENLGSCMLACDKLMFLGKYYLSLFNMWFRVHSDLKSLENLTKSAKFMFLRHGEIRKFVENRETQFIDDY